MLDKGARGGPSAPHLPPEPPTFWGIQAAAPPCRATQAYQPQGIKGHMVFGHPVVAQPSELSTGIKDRVLWCHQVSVERPPEFSGNIEHLPL